jgi:hypothetical protein
MKIWLFLLIGLAINNANSLCSNSSFDPNLNWGGCDRMEVNSPVVCCQNFRNNESISMMCAGLDCSRPLHNIHIGCLNNVLEKRKNISEEERRIINTEISRITQAFNNRHSFGFLNLDIDSMGLS